MGRKSKPLHAILCDYLLCGGWGLAYFLIDTYMVAYTQCIPSSDSNEPNCTDYMDDATPLLGYPYRTNDVPTSYPYVFGALTWFAVILMSLCIIRPSLDEFTMIFFQMEALFREVLTTVLITQTTIGFLKRHVARPRPNYYNYRSVDSVEARESFPSGHTSSTFCIHILLVYHVIGSIRWSQLNHTIICGVDNMHALFGARLWQKTRNLSGVNVLIVMWLLALPIWISCSRIKDYYHNYSDVIGGALFGVMIGTIVFCVFHNELYPRSQLYNKSARERLLSNVADN